MLVCAELERRAWAGPMNNIARSAVWSLISLFVMIGVLNTICTMFFDMQTAGLAVVLFAVSAALIKFGLPE